MVDASSSPGLTNYSASQLERNSTCDMPRISCQGSSSRATLGRLHRQVPFAMKLELSQEAQRTPFHSQALELEREPD